MVGPEALSKKKLEYIPIKEEITPIIIDKNITLVKLFDNIRADIAGPTITEAKRVTPIDDIETIIIVANRKENNNSTYEVLIPAIWALSLSKNVKTNLLCKKKKKAPAMIVTNTIINKS